MQHTYEGYQATITHEPADGPGNLGVLRLRAYAGLETVEATIRYNSHEGPRRGMLVLAQMLETVADRLNERGPLA